MSGRARPDGGRSGRGAPGAAVVAAVVVGLALAGLGARGAPAHADGLWERATGGDARAAAREVYDAWMREGDDQAIRASVDSLRSRAELKRAINAGIQAYRNAAGALPDAAEPHYRIGTLIDAFFFACGDRSSAPAILCDPAALSSRARAEEAITAWDAFEARAPLDPRVPELTFRRAILHTRLATPTHLAAAATDYQRLIDHGVEAGETVWGNLAETHMMLGDLDAAIAAYRQAIARGGQISTIYGLAVALDRDGRATQAREAILGLGREAVIQFKLAVDSNRTFYVPTGEVFYYYGLIDEAFGFDADALTAWDLYLKSGAHPRYQPRARAHLDALTKKHPHR